MTSGHICLRGYKVRSIPGALVMQEQLLLETFLILAKCLSIVTYTIMCIFLNINHNVWLKYIIFDAFNQNWTAIFESLCHHRSPSSQQMIPLRPCTNQMLYGTAEESSEKKTRQLEEQITFPHTSLCLCEKGGVYRIKGVIWILSTGEANIIFFIKHEQHLGFSQNFE